MPMYLAVHPKTSEVYTVEDVCGGWLAHIQSSGSNSKSVGLTYEDPLLAVERVERVAREPLEWSSLDLPGEETPPDVLDDMMEMFEFDRD